ncbi:hypothetical protein RCH11_001930 [Glaciihabitans sp. GrIS 2.15]|nr:hypothetical protein [Glaciihabitans sp. GrIS 2.15]
MARVTVMVLVNVGSAEGSTSLTKPIGDDAGAGRAGRDTLC